MVKTKHKYQYDKRNPILDTTNFPIGSLVLQYPKKKAREKRPFFSLNAGPLPLSANTHTHSLFKRACLASLTLPFKTPHSFCFG